MSKVVVVGGGVIGCAIAERLSFEGHQVTCSNATSWAAAPQEPPQAN